MELWGGESKKTNPWPLIVGAGVVLLPLAQKVWADLAQPAPAQGAAVTGLQRQQLEAVLAAWAKPQKALNAGPSSYVPPVDEALARLIHHPSVVLTLGHRGGGKTALNIRIQELLRDIAPAYAVGMPARASHLLPDWYGLVEDFDTIPANAIIYVPESYRLFHARAAGSNSIGDVVNLSRQRRHTLLFDVQNPAHLDRNIVSEADIVLIKEPGPLQQGFERSQFKVMMDSARAAFASVGQFRKKRVVWVVAPSAGIDGQLMENLLPTCWTPAISSMFGDPSIKSSSKGHAKDAIPRAGKRTTVSSKGDKAKKMRAAGHTYGEIGNTLGVTKGYAYKLANP